MPKPTGNIAMLWAKESVFLINKSGPAIQKVATSSASLGFITAAGCIAIILVDDSTRNMIMDQISQILSLFQNENGKTTNSSHTLENQEGIDVRIEKPEYKRPHYYLQFNCAFLPLIF